MGKEVVLKASKHILDFTRQIRRDILRMNYDAGTSHVGSALSCADLLACLYSGVLRVRPRQPEWPGRDRFILSKGHACSALYAVLAGKNFFPKKWLHEYCCNGSVLGGHVSHKRMPGVEVSTGSLGHGLSIAAGIAAAAQASKSKARSFCLLSEGDCDSGATWEAAMLAAQHRLDRLVAIIDYNKIQSLGFSRDIVDLEPLGEKWKAFGWEVREIDGHKNKQIFQSLKRIPFRKGKPSCLMAHTVKGKGVSFMENKLLWHYRSPDKHELAKALKELETQ